MKFMKQLRQFAFAASLASALGGTVVAQGQHNHLPQAQQQYLSPAQSELLKIVHDATERFKDPIQAEKEGYNLMFGCVSGPDSGAMGLHYVNLDLVMAGVVDPTRPQIIIYEPTPSGRLKLTGADFLILAGDWDKAHPGLGAPQLMGQLYHYFESPNRFGLPAFYTLHVWAWKDNPNGAFVNWHPNVSCKEYSPQ